jgi:hypothetical protein
MEAFGLFANAKHLGKMRQRFLRFRILSLRTKIFLLMREKALKPMMELALESGLRVCNHYRLSKIKEFYIICRTLFYILKKLRATSVVSSATSAMLIFFRWAIVCATYGKRRFISAVLHSRHIFRKHKRRIGFNHHPVERNIFYHFFQMFKPVLIADGSGKS